MHMPATPFPRLNDKRQRMLREEPLMHQLGMQNKEHLMKLRHATILFVLLVTGCALTPKTEINYVQPKFSSNAIKSLGILKSDTYTMMPMSTSQIVAMQFGAIGAVVGIAIESAKNSSDNSIDEEGIALHRKSIVLLKERLSTNHQIPFKAVSNPELDSVALSRRLRDLRLQGGEGSTKAEIVEFAGRHGLDYVLYTNTWGGFDKNKDDQVFLATDWRIYDSNGRQAVFIFTRSVGEKPLSSTSTPPTLTDKLLELLNENVTQFLGAVTNLPTADIAQK
jgi:hypothetical protein